MNLTNSFEAKRETLSWKESLIKQATLPEPLIPLEDLVSYWQVEKNDNLLCLGVVRQGLRVSQ
jgi:hypothetical protein